MMATCSELINFYTLPTTYVGPKRVDHEKPYAAVAGIKVGATTLLASGFQQQNIEFGSLSFMANTLFCDRLLKYFRQYYHYSGSYIRYNCHVAAAVVGRGFVGATAYHDAMKRADNIMRDGKELDFSNGLQLGTRAVIGNLATNEAYHSVIGLGLNTPYLLQTMDCEGPMGITTLDYLKTELERAIILNGFTGRKQKYCVE